MKQILLGDELPVMIKVAVRASNDRVLGVHMIGSDVAEIIQALGIAVKHGVTKADFDRTRGVHPTAAEKFSTLR